MTRMHREGNGEGKMHKIKEVRDMRILNYMTLPLPKSHASMMTKRPLYIS